MMTLDQSILTERKILSPEFYRRDFQDLKCAADFLRVPTAELASLFYDEYGVSLQDFILLMRVEDVKDHLCQINPQEPLRCLAALYGFQSEVHLLQYFYQQERCAPHQWAYKMGCLPLKGDTNPRVQSIGYVFAASLLFNLLLLAVCILFFWR